MKQTMKHLHIGLALFLAMFANLGADQGWAQSTPQQVKGSNWEVLTEASPAVAINGSAKYMAWQGSNSNEIYFSTFTNGAWTKPTIVGGTDPSWTAETSAAPALAWDPVSNLVWLGWKAKSSSDEIWFTTWNGKTWASQAKVSGTDPNWTAKTGAAPALSYTHGAITLAWMGASSHEVWYTVWLSSHKWASQIEVAGSKTSTGPAIESVTYAALWLWKGYSNEDIYFLNSSTQITDAETDATPTAFFYGFDDGQEGTNVVFWKNSSDNSIFFTDDYPDGFDGYVRPVSGNGWNAETDVAPAVTSFVSGNGSTGSILAWKNASDHTVWFLDPTTLIF
jgi:hypothetical protein